MEPTSKLSIRYQFDQCGLLGIHRSGLYYAPAQESEENLANMPLLEEHYLARPTRGVLQMLDYLRDEGYRVNHKRGRRLLRHMGLEAHLLQKEPEPAGPSCVYTRLSARGLEIGRCNQVWETDITYIAIGKGFMYLTAVIDVYSRFIVGWSLSNNREAEVSLAVLREAIARHGKPEIVNSDQGSQFTCKEWVGYLKGERIAISMDGKGRALVNIYIERLWRTLKQDYVYMNPAKDGWELYQEVKSFFEFYNHRESEGVFR
ncbi:putative transposase [Pontibacter ummariensis]|uniref:Putative transposase n=1 Tax=Pontibacter ummariensis TaxID=1610492 RepID=A0A239BKV8_9BACT|nr:IS3 family transposase [Pontibacter ummariensis]PRY15762.1 putative transposase [Pontibacter ummariensis]SNS08785.1 putative transposase [Pontibacter ummariensis]